MERENKRGREKSRTKGRYKEWKKKASLVLIPWARESVRIHRCLSPVFLFGSHNDRFADEIDETWSST